jgi:extracellular elastinolytic metalloproteinase
MTPTFTTKGNNAQAQENWQAAFVVQPVAHRPVSPTRDYVYPWENVWYETLCNQANFVPGIGNDINAAVTNLFVMHNWSYNLGFREDTWNGQEHNFGIRPEGERDSIIGLAQAGAVTGGYPNYSGRDNAYMATRPDGTNSFSGMFLWQPLAGAFYSPCVDGDYDMDIIGHEYGHMIENRMIGKGNRRLGTHAGMMGESHGDLLGVEYINEYNFVPAGGGDNNVAGATKSVVGPYATGNDIHGSATTTWRPRSARSTRCPGSTRRRTR